MRVLFMFFVCFLAGALIAWGSAYVMLDDQTSLSKWITDMINSSADATEDGSQVFNLIRLSILSILYSLVNIGLPMFEPIRAHLKRLCRNR